MAVIAFDTLKCAQRLIDAGVPEKQAQVQVEVMAEAFVYNMDAFSGNLNLNANWSYKSDITQFEIASPDLDQDSYDIVNASVVWTSPSESWLLGLHGKNLTDEDVKTAGYCFGFQNCPSDLGLENNTTIFYGPPRTWSATVEYRF